MKQITIILIFILFTNCKKEQDKSIAISVEKDVLSTKVIENESEIPNEIKTYIDSNGDVIVYNIEKDDSRA